MCPPDTHTNTARGTAAPTQLRRGLAAAVRLATRRGASAAKTKQAERMAAVEIESRVQLLRGSAAQLRHPSQSLQLQRHPGRRFPDEESAE
ncbi:unnamed protein product [Lampetra planeri]